MGQYFEGMIIASRPNSFTTNGNPLLSYFYVAGNLNMPLVCPSYLYISLLPRKTTKTERHRRIKLYEKLIVTGQDRIFYGRTYFHE